MMSARTFASASPGKAITVPGTTACGAARKRSSVASSQVSPLAFIAGE